MNETKLKQVAARHVPKEHKLKNALWAFFFGGSLAIACQFICTSLINSGLVKEDASLISILIVIFTTAVLTGLGVYDKVAQVVGAGLFIPISGFANSLASEALECKSEGFIYGVGSNMFKLAGSVLTYGIVAALVFGAIRYGVSLL